MGFAKRIVAVAFVLVAMSCSNERASDYNVSLATDQHRKQSLTALSPTGRVTDAANILSQGQINALADKLEMFELRTKHQLAVVTAPSLSGKDIDTFTTDLARSWGVGRKGYNDGVVLLLAPNERKVRISVGYGLEKRLSNALCQEIIKLEMLPRFKMGDYAGGLEAGATAIIDHLN